ncbi:hypothetical protein ACFWP7_31630 [Streptomyces sp. NPDC058470]|uniref:hypothetical protein n=1 Tax=Streptomyces sp. NPDC058470 TaxID=3346515 RepID=UPI003647AAD5
MRPTRVRLPQLPASHREALHAHGLRNFQLGKTGSETQLLPHAGRRQDVIE